MHAALRCPEDTLSTDLWKMAMDYAVWVYNRTPDIQYCENTQDPDHRRAVKIRICS